MQDVSAATEHKDWLVEMAETASADRRLLVILAGGSLLGVLLQLASRLASSGSGAAAQVGWLQALASKRCHAQPLAPAEHQRAVLNSPPACRDPHASARAWVTLPCRFLS